MKLFSRRRFLGLGGAVLAGGLVASRIVQPFNVLALQRGQALPPLPEVRLDRSQDGLVQAQLTAIESAVVVGGVIASLLSYNRSFPGPLLKLREGERVHLEFNNRLDEHTSLHLHGLPISPSVDDPFRHGHPGDQSYYDFVLPPGSAGTYWYHPHLHGQTARQLFSGMVGVITVAGPLDELPALKAAEDHVLLLKDISLSGVEPSTTYSSLLDSGGKEGSLLTVNGAVQPVLTANASTLRLRFANASNAHFYKLNLEGHPLHLIASDGGMLERPVSVNQINLAPGERAEALVQLDQAGRFRLLDGSNELLTIVAPSPSGSAPLPLPERLATIEQLDLSKAVIKREVVFDVTGIADWQINNQIFDPNRVDFVAKQGTLEIWELHNAHRRDHPFHLHSYPFQVLERDGQTDSYRAWHDTVNLKPGQRVRIAVPLRNYAGRTVFHCHVAEHNDNGMMAVLEVQP